MHSPLAQAAPISQAAGVSVRYSRAGQQVHALTEIDLDIQQGETVAIIGESGCGKSTLGRVLLLLQEPSAGAVRFRGEDLTGLSRGVLRRRRQAMQMIFQDPFASLNPRMTIGETLAEPLVVHRLASWRGAREPVAAILQRVGLDPDVARRYPHEFSGGQRQRIAIARAVIGKPALVVADEPLSALDISVQGQILDLFASLQEALGLTYVFISHDLPVVRHVAGRVAVMLGGRIVEQGEPEPMFLSPAHPYTRALLDAVPRPDPGLERQRRERHEAASEPAGTVTFSAGCPFVARCPHAMPVCSHEMPALRHVAPQWKAACWLHEVPQ